MWKLERRSEADRSPTQHLFRSSWSGWQLQPPQLLPHYILKIYFIYWRGRNRAPNC